MRREMLQRYERSASQLLCRLEESLGQAAAWEAGSLSAVSAAETCHGLITDVRIAGATTVAGANGAAQQGGQLARLVALRSAFDDFSCAATSGPLDALRSLSTHAGSCRAGLLRIVAARRAGQEAVEPRKAANAIAEAAQAHRDLCSTLIGAQQAFAAASARYHFEVARALAMGNRGQPLRRAASSSALQAASQEAIVVDEGWAEFQDAAPSITKRRQSFSFILSAADRLSSLVVLLTVVSAAVGGEGCVLATIITAE